MMFTWKRLDFWHEVQGNYSTYFPSMERVPFHKVRAAVIGNYSLEWLWENDTKMEMGDIMPSSIFVNRCCIEGVFHWPTTFGYAVPEWNGLTQEILERLSSKRVVFVLLDSVAHWNDRFIDTSYCPVIYTRHRWFSTMNAALNDICLEPVDIRSRAYE